MEQVYQMIEEYIHFYNHSCFQEKWNGLSSMEYREKAANRYTPFIVQLKGVMRTYFIFAPLYIPLKEYYLFAPRRSGTPLR